MEYFWIILAICGLSGGVVLLVLMSDTSDAITEETDDGTAWDSNAFPVTGQHWEQDE